MFLFRPVSAVIILSVVMCSAHGQSLPPHAILSLAEAERLALEYHPLLLQSGAQIQAASARAVASDRLPDPQISMGFQNLPVDSFALDKDEMTMVTVGIAQMFPPVGSRRLKQQAADQAMVAAKAERLDIAARIVRDTRRAWLALFYLDKALQVNRTTYAIAAQMVDAEQARYRTGATEQLTVLRSIMEREELLIQEQELLLQRQQSEAALWRLLSNDHRPVRLPENLPQLPPLLASAQVLDTISRHPQVQMIDAQRRAASFDIAGAKRSYYPAFGIEADYGYRAGQDFNGAQLPAMLSTKVVMSMPLFGVNRQAAMVEERHAVELGLRYQRDDVLADLQQQIQTRAAEYHNLQQRIGLIEQQLPRIEQSVQAGLTALRNSRADIAQVLALVHQRHIAVLRKWRLQIDSALANVELAYLTTTSEELAHELK